eukprot:g14948.t1
MPTLTEGATHQLLTSASYGTRGATPPGSGPGRRGRAERPAHIRGRLVAEEKDPWSSSFTPDWNGQLPRGSGQLKLFLDFSGVTSPPPSDNLK